MTFFPVDMTQSWETLGILYLITVHTKKSQSFDIFRYYLMYHVAPKIAFSIFQFKATITRVAFSCDGLQCEIFLFHLYIIKSSSGCIISRLSYLCKVCISVCAALLPARSLLKSYSSSTKYFHISSFVEYHHVTFFNREKIKKYK